MNNFFVGSFATVILVVVIAWLMANPYKNKRKLNNNVDSDVDIDDDINVIEFVNWLQDNYSTNKIEGESDPLPKGYWRKDFTNEHYQIEDIFVLYKNRYNNDIFIDGHLL